MKRLLLLIFILLINLPVYSYEIAFPLEKNVTLMQDGIFFVGKVNKKESLWINDTLITPKSNGSFAESFKLKAGENIFNLGTSLDNLNDRYTITCIKPTDLTTELIEFSPKDCKTTRDDVILRATPIDFGMNRLAYLPKNTDLKITGIKNEFSRVYLNPNLSGWVFTKHIIPEQRDVMILGEFRGQNIKSEHGLDTYVYKFSKNLPYAVVFKDKKLLIDVFNVENRKNETFHTELTLKTPYCYSSRMQDGELIISIPDVDFSKNHTKVVIDPGHGGIEHGAVGCLSDLEKNMNLKAAKYVYKELKSHKYKVFLTRKNDKFVSLQDRVNFTKDKKAVIFVSLHMNSVPENVDPKTHKGTETYYYNEFAKPFAECLQSELTKSIGTNNNGVIQASFAVIRPTEYVGVLIETAYLVNPDDVEIYKSKSYFKQVATGVLNGINKFLYQK